MYTCVTYKYLNTCIYLLHNTCCAGLYLCCGCANGSFWFLDPCLLVPIINTPFKRNYSPVRQITFSESSSYVVYTVSF